MEIAEQADGALAQGHDMPSVPSNAAPRAAAKPAKPPKRRMGKFWLKQLHTWHWVSAAISLVGMLLFSITGITLNHAESISATPDVTTRSAVLPRALLPQLSAERPENAPLPDTVASEIRDLVGINAAGKPGEWSDEEVYIAIPGPGSDAWVSIERATGAIESERTDRGWISYFNDLHKGRDSGSVWFWFIDVFAVACIVFTITGLLLLQLHAKHRPSTWPMVGLGLAIPAAIAIFFIH